MQILICPNCRMRVLASAGRCPSCKHLFSEVACPGSGSAQVPTAPLPAARSRPDVIAGFSWLFFFKGCAAAIGAVSYAAFILGVMINQPPPWGIIILPVAVGVFALFCLWLSYGLWELKPWSRIVLSLFIVVTLPILLLAPHLILVNLYFLYRLNTRETREAFRRRA
jgi:hypothetical protein